MPVLRGDMQCCSPVEVLLVDVYFGVTQTFQDLVEVKLLTHMYVSLGCDNPERIDSKLVCFVNLNVMVVQHQHDNGFSKT